MCNFMQDIKVFDELCLNVYIYMYCFGIVYIFYLNVGLVWVVVFEVFDGLMCLYLFRFILICILMGIYIQGLFQ